jgi:TonB-linked SusC/RagA family outer membrane protein
MNLTALRIKKATRRPITHPTCAEVLTQAFFVMKLTGIFLLAGLLQLSAKSYSQTVTLSRRDLPLAKVFEAIQDQTGYNFMCTLEQLEHTQKISLHVKNEPLLHVLNLCFKDQPLTYTIENRTIIVRRKSADGPSPRQVTVSLAQLTGTVRDSASGKPLAGVSVRVKGTTLGTVTDAEGRFSLEVPTDAVLVCSYLGYNGLERPVNGMATMVVSMSTAKTALDQLVIIGYGQVKKTDLTGAVSTINVARDLKNVPVTRVDQMLQGRAAGVDVKSVNGAPGAGTTIRIRGSRSINASNEPLYVVDGMVGAGDLNSINPADIASIEILKDASAAAIYGSRASNGVVLITTKKGTVGENKINFSATYGLQVLPRTLDLMNAREFAEFENDDHTFQNLPLLYPNVDSLVAKIGKGTNWTREVTRPAPYANYNLAFSGGSNGLTYYISGNLVQQDGIIIGSDYKRYQTHLNLTKTVSPRFKMGINLNISRYHIDNTQISLGANLQWPNSILTLPPTMAVYKPDGSYESFNPIYYAGGGYIDNPVATAKMVTDYTNTNDLLGNVYGEFTILQGLKFKSSFGTEMTYNRTNYYSPSNTPLKIARNTQTGNASATISTSTYLLSENTLTYEKNFHKHHLDLLGGFTYQQRLSDGLYGSGSGLTDDILQFNNLSVVQQDLRGLSSSYDKNVITSLVGRADYSYNDRYYLTATARYDGASNFAENKKWGFFPSLSATWRISQEPFFQALPLSRDLLSDVALRASYGMSGNQGISDYQSLASISSNSSAYLFGGNQVLGFTQSNLANNSLSWETTAQANIGLDLALLNGRITLDANYYNMHTKNLLLSVQVPSQTGYGSRLVNLGKTMSSGFEFALNGSIIDKPDFSWSLTVNLATNHQDVLDLGPLVKVALDNNNYGAVTNYLQVGVPVGANFGLVYAGTWKNQQEIDAERAKPSGERTYVSSSSLYRPGGPKYLDYNHDGALNIDDYHYLGTPNPRVYGGVGNTLRYKHLTLDFFLQYNLGNTMYNDIEFFMGSGTGLTNQFAYMVNRWSARNPDSNVPAVESRDNVPSTRFLHSASLLRLKSLTLTYDLSQQVFKNSLKSLDVFVAGTNLFLVTRYNGFDPEVNSGGTSSTVRAKDNGTYPNSRTYSVGLNLGF